MVGSNNRPYVAVDTIDDIRIYPVNLITLTIDAPLSTPNISQGYASTFLYWYVQDSNLYLIQGYSTNQVATYQVELGTTPVINPGVATDLSGTFTQINSCATCLDYLLLGGTNNSTGLLGIFNVNATGIS